MADLSNITDGQLRAMADCRAISSARYVEEMERRRAAAAPRAIIEHAPPLDYALDDDLSIPFLHHDNFLDLGDDGIGPMPPPPAAKWIALIAAALFVVAIWMVLP